MSSSKNRTSKAQGITACPGFTAEVQIQTVLWVKEAVKPLMVCHRPERCAQSANGECILLLLSTAHATVPFNRASQKGRSSSEVRSQRLHHQATQQSTRKPWKPSTGLLVQLVPWSAKSGHPSKPKRQRAEERKLNEA